MRRKKNIKGDKFKYCDNRECADMSCQRWYKHAPFDEMITVVRYKLDKDGKCKERI